MPTAYPACAFAVPGLARTRATRAVLTSSCRAPIVPRYLRMTTASASLPLDASAVIEPSSGAHDSAVILLHGSYHTGDGAREWFGGEEGPLAFERTRVVFPTAPIRDYSLVGGQGRVWFDRVALGPTGKEDVEGMDAMAKRVNELVLLEVAKGVPLKRIIVGGFSMGGAQALHTVLADADADAMAGETLAGVFAMSTFLADDSVLPERLKELAKKGAVPPVLCCHGEADAMINCGWGKASARRLTDAGAQVEWRTYPGVGHDVCHEELRDVREWILARLAE